MQRTRNDEKKVKLAILKTVMKTLGLLGERYIVLVNDLLPFITETLHDVDIQVNIYIYYIRLKRLVKKLLFSWKIYRVKI